MGIDSFAMIMAENIALQAKKSVAIFSMAMPHDLLGYAHAVISGAY